MTTKTTERKFTGSIAKYYSNHAWTLQCKLDDLRQNLGRFGVGVNGEIDSDLADIGVGDHTEILTALRSSQKALESLHSAIENCVAKK